MKVSIIKQDNYDYNKIKETLLKTLDNLGGTEKFIKKGDRILLKPNLLMKKKPEDATTTHPAMIKALAEIIIDHGGTVLIGDSPGGPFISPMLNTIYKSTGMMEATNIKNTELNYNFNSFTKEFKEGVILNNILLTDMINDVDKIINVSKLKTHGFAVFTGAVKNLFGLVPGTNKAEFHVKMPDINDFADSLIDICESVTPVLHIMDGIDAMEGAGPSGGSKRHLGLLLASENPHHLDLCACKIIGLDINDVPTLRKAMDRNMIGNFDFSKDILGEKIENLIVSDFKKAPANSGNLRNIPKPIMNLLIDRLKSKPVFHHDICIGCGDCAANCPPVAIDMIDRKPEVDYDKCISCFCCQELCPVQAITIKKPFLAKIIFK
ncbi:MAG: DUF362 domain-containing protein [Bacillota bacterium]|nr:DUF362 domain-containing protein [Bacillota bacterium]